MQNNYIKFDISFYIITILAIGLGFVDQYIIFVVTILIHELGHLIMAALCRWKLEELKFSGVGGVLRFSGELNKSNTEDILISLGGVLFNLLFLIVLLSFRDFPMSPVILKKYQYLIFAQLFTISFNLIPLPPLDGNRVLTAVLCYFFPYKFVLKLTAITNFLILGIIIIGIMFFSEINQFILILNFLIYSTLKYNRERKYLFQRFLLQKNLYRDTKLSAKTVTISKGTWEDNIYRGYSNKFQTQIHLKDEITCLNVKYDEKKYE